MPKPNTPDKFKTILAGRRIDDLRELSKAALELADYLNRTLTTYGNPLEVVKDGNGVVYTYCTDASGDLVNFSLAPGEGVKYDYFHDSVVGEGYHVILARTRVRSYWLREDGKASFNCPAVHQAILRLLVAGGRTDEVLA